MARFTESSRDLIDETVDRWKSACLLETGSLIFEDGADVWTVEHVAELRRRFNDEQLLGSEGGGTFDSKWDHQMGDASEGVRLLAAEVLLVHFLFASSVKKPKKLEVIGRSLVGTGITLPETSVAIRAMGQSIGNPGIGFNTRRDVQLSYLIDFIERFKALPLDNAGALLDSPWELRDFADDTEWSVREMRHVLLHLLQPDHFERISSGTHKREIADALRRVLDEEPPEGLDEQLLAIRKELETQLPEGNTPKRLLDFYYPPLRGIWESSGGGGGDDAGDIESVEWKKQIILFGPPGTGKTFQANLLAKRLIRRAALDRWGAKAYFSRTADVDRLIASNVRRLQLHPGYGYEQFIRGLRIEGEGTRYRAGALPNFVAELERQQPPDGLDPLPGVLVLDEINRTDLSAMLGEAFSLLERDQRGKAVELPGFDAGQEPDVLMIPPDLYVIGTMNEIDQSVETLDFALRRRFYWRLCPFEREALLGIVDSRWTGDVGRWSYEDAADQLDVFANRAAKLNAEIAASPELGKQYEIGHTYFADIAFFMGRWARTKARRPRNGTWLWSGTGQAQPPLMGLWARSIGPLLEQYLAGSDIRDAELARLQTVLLLKP